MYLVLFSIVLYRTIVTVYTDHNFLYNYHYRRQMYIIIQFSRWGVLPQPEVKSVQKNHEVSGVNKLVVSKY